MTSSETQEMLRQRKQTDERCLQVRKGQRRAPITFKTVQGVVSVS